VATNLLLEGDDLEALLIRAHSEGGPNARIVRADKFRHGGFWGFFAKERFEVAVEIPEANEPGAAFFAGGRAPEASAPRPADGATPRVPAPRPAGDTAPARPDAARPDAVRAAPRPPRPNVVRTVSPEVARALELERDLDAGVPGALAAQGLLGLADRVSAAERAAERRDVVDVAPTTISLPRTELVGATLASTGAVGGRPGFGGASASAARSGDRPGAAPGAREGRTDLGTPASGAPAGGIGSPPPLLAGGRGGRGTGHGFGSGIDPLEIDEDDEVPQLPEALDLLRAVAADEVPHEPSVSPVRPSTTRPEFTALLDQLRQGSRPSSATPARTAAQTAAYLAAELIDEPAPAMDQPLELPEPVAVPAPRGPVRTEEPAGRDPFAEPEREPVRPGDPRTADERVAADRTTLRTLGVPAAWTRRMRAGDRFEEVLRMLERMPDPDISADAPVIAVIGPASVVRLEAYRTAIDLAVGDQPRPVVSVPAEVGTQRAAAISRALRSGPVVVAVETDGRDAGVVLDTLTAVHADVVLAVVDATVPLEVTQRWLDALGRVDALTLEGGSEVADPASVLELGLPVVRFDGIPVDRVTWTALLCAQLLAADAVAQPALRVMAGALDE
jgi:hypothetical protein